MRSYKMEFKKLVYAALICTFITPAYATELVSFEQIKTLTTEFIQHNVKLDPDDTIDIRINKASAALRLPVCSNPIEANFPKDGNREQISSVELSCNGTSQWHTFVPVEVQVNTKVLVAKNTIPANEPITENDLEYVSYDKNRLFNGYFKNKAEVIKNVASHAIAAGSVLNKKNVQAPVVIHKNQLVTITATRNAITVSMQGIAQTDGALNGLIQVFNPSSKRTMDAIVTGPSRAEVVA